MSQAQSLLIIGGLVNLLLSILASYFLFWQRVSHPEIPAQRYGLVTHKVTLWNGFLLLGLSVAIEHTGYADSIKLLLAAMEVIASLTSDAGNIIRWYQKMDDQFMRGPEWRVRASGLVHLLDLTAISAILVGVTRTALNLW